MQPFISSTIFIFTALFKAPVKGFGRLVVVGAGGHESVVTFHAPQVVGNGSAYCVPFQVIFG